MSIYNQLTVTTVSSLAAVARAADTVSLSINIVADLAEAAAHKSSLFKEEVKATADARKAVFATRAQEVATRDYYNHQSALAQDLKRLGVSQEQFEATKAHLFPAKTEVTVLHAAE